MATESMSTARIQIRLDTTQPVELVELALSFQAIAFEYRKFLSERMREKGARPDDSDVKLYITSLESGSILAELGSAWNILGQFFSVMDYVNIFVDFTKNIKGTIEYFRGIARAGSADPKDVKYSKGECERISDVLRVIADSKTGSLGINVIEYEQSAKDAKSHLRIKFSSDEAFEARKGALLARKALEVTGDADHKNVLMYFYQTNIDDPKADGRTGDKAIIKSVWPKPLSVYFISELDQQKIRNVIHDSHLNPLKASYRVDVNVETDRNDVPRFYRVMNVHEVIPGDDDNTDDGK